MDEKLIEKWKKLYEQFGELTIEEALTVIVDFLARLGAVVAKGEGIDTSAQELVDIERVQELAKQHENSLGLRLAVVAHIVHDIKLILVQPINDKEE